jgi:Ca2+-binding RTX toxin-like protein
MLAGVGNDALEGGDGDDSIHTGRGLDIVGAELANDVVYSLANDRRADEMTYGEGIDVVFVRAADAVADDCETVIRLGADVKGRDGDDS